MSDQVLAEAPSSEVNTTASIQFSIENAALSKALRMLSGVDHAQVIQILGFIKCILEKIAC